tara:strand:- start:11068 stop:12708 length:1641 start_codon:yes stop_codon:yes gene_type:complete
MSRHAYDTFTIAPDFSQVPFYGLAGTGGRKDTSIGQGQSYAAWRGSTPLTIGFSFRCATVTAAIALREEMNRFRGRSTAFYLPSWQRDFRLAASATAGDTSITIVDGGLSAMTTNRPDTEGRVLFVSTPSGSVQIIGIETAVDSGANEILTLDQPLLFDLEQTRSMIGFAYLVRLADDEVSWRYDAPGHASAGLRFISVRNRRYVDQALEVASDPVLNLQPFLTAVATDEDGDLTRRLAPLATGPDVYNTPQSTHYEAPWRATFTDPTTVSLEQLDSAAIEVSALYDGLTQAEHLAFGFDSANSELLAWQGTTRGEIRLRYYAGGSPQSLDFAGISPQIFNSFILDGISTLGDSETVVFYLKTGFSAIFGRFERESYATEWKLGSFSSALIYLHGIRQVANQMLLDGMDAQHRDVVLTSSQYPNLPTIEPITLSLSLNTGSYDQISVMTEVVTETLELSFALAAGAYTSSTVESEMTTETIELAFALAAGAYTSALELTEMTTETPVLSFVLEAGVYFEASQLSEVVTETTELAFGLKVGAYTVSP